jgi:N-methylhydantoinase A
MPWRIGADIGGTFIDFCALETQTNRLESLKVLTTPEEPGRELMDGLARRSASTRSSSARARGSL